MTTAPQMPGFTKTVNAVVIRSTAGFGCPDRKANEIKALDDVKINADFACNTQRWVYD